MEPPSSAGQATQPDVHAFHVPASSDMQCMQCRRGIHELGHRSFGDCPEYRGLSRDMRVPPFPVLLPPGPQCGASDGGCTAQDQLYDQYKLALHNKGCFTCGDWQHS